MAIGETAELLVLLRLKNELGAGVTQAEAQLVGLNRGATGAHGALTRTAAQATLMGRATTGMGQALGHAKGAIGGVISSVGLLGGTFAAFAGGAALGGAVKSAMNFQQQMELIRTQAGATQGEVDRMTAAVMKMAPAVAVGPEALAMGLYHVESVGLRGARALDVLTAAAQGARVGNADLESVTNALAAAAYSGIKGVQNMSEAMGALDAIVGAGNMRMQDLANAMGTGILAAGRAAGLSLKDVGSAMAVMTDQGVPAVVAATRLRMAFALMQAPSGKAQDQLKAIGIGATQLADDMRKPNGLMVALTDLHDHLLKLGEINKTTGELTSAGAATVLRSFGGGRTGIGIVTLLDSLGKLQAKYDIITKQTGMFGDKVAATQDTAAYKFARFQASLSALGIQLGNVLLPGFAELANAGASFLSDNQSGIVGGLHAAVDAAKLLGTALGVVFKVLGGITGIISSIPGGSLGMEALLGGAIAGKASSLLFGKNPFTWAISSMLGRGGKGGVGGALGGAAGAMGGAIPVYVVNMGAGGLGGPGGIGGPAAAGGGSLVAALGLTGIAALGTAQQLTEAYNFNQQRQQLRQQYTLTNAEALALQLQKQGGIDALYGRARGSAGQAFMQDNTTYAAALASAEAKIAGAASAAATKAVLTHRFGSGAGAAGADRLTEGLLWSSRGGNFKTLTGAIALLHREQQAAHARGDVRTASRISQDVHRLEQRLSLVEERRGQQITNALNSVKGVLQTYFPGVIAAIQGISIPAMIGGVQQVHSRSSSAPIRGMKASAPVGTEGNRGYVGLTVHVNSSARQNEGARTIQYRYGATPSSAGAT